LWSALLPFSAPRPGQTTRICRRDRCDQSEPYDKEYVPRGEAVADGGGKYIVRGATVVRCATQNAHCRDGVREHGKAQAAFDSSAFKEAKKLEQIREFAYMPWKAYRNETALPRPRMTDSSAAETSLAPRASPC
jgi:hypothetical protein